MISKIAVLQNVSATYVLLQGAAAIATLLMTYLACHPILAFVRRGWIIKRDDILSSMKTDAKRLYLKTFLKKSSKHPDADFDAMYTYRYGRYRLWVSVSLLILVLLPELLLVAETAMPQIEWVHCGTAGCPLSGPFLSIPAKAVAAIMGAYTWVVFGLVYNTTRHNLQPSFVLGAALRIVVAAPLGFAISALVKPGLGIFLAFAVGAFPLQTVQTILQRIATNKLGLDLGPDPKSERNDLVTKLNGVDPSTADRLQDADITTIPQLAYCDPVPLSMSSNMRFDAIVDLVAQGIAWLYFGEKLNLVRPYGLRGAIEAFNLRYDLMDGTAHDKQMAQRTLAACAEVTGLDAEGLKNGLNEIADDPYTIFLTKVWPE